MLDAQRLVEVEAAGVAATAAKPEDLARLDAALANAEALVDEPAQFTAASMAFHAAVGEASRNAFLAAMMQAIALALERVAAPDTNAAVARNVVTRHRALLAAIRAKDAAAARQLVSAHLDIVHGHIRRRLADRQG